MKLTQANLFVFTVLLLMFGQIFAVFTKITRIPTFYPSFALLLLFTVLINPSIFRSMSFLFTILLWAALSLFNTANHLMNLPDVLLKPFGIFSLVFPYLVTSITLENLFIFNRKDKSVPIRIGKFFLIIFILGLLITLINEKLFPGITRGANKQNLPVWAWALSFGSIYGIPYVLMTIIAFYKGNRIKLFFFILVIFFMIIYSGFLIALVISLIASLSGLLFRLNIRKGYLIFFPITLIVIFVVFNFDILVDFLPELPNEAFQSKANDLYELQENKKFSDLIFDARQGVYYQSLEAISIAPFFGTGNYNYIGQHSYILDKIGFIGLFGIAFYIFVLHFLYRRSISLLNKQEIKFYRMVLVIYTGYLLLNPSEYIDLLLIIFVFIPSLIIFLRDKFQIKSDEDTGSA